MTKHYSDAIHTAVSWYVQLTSGEATDQDHQAWQTWLNDNPEHQRAWQQLESVTDRFKGMEPTAAMAVLNRPQNGAGPASSGRRQAIKHLSLLFAVGSAGWLTYKEKPWLGMLADYSTGTGEIKNVSLEDGTRLVLNTSTKITVDFNQQKRLVRLLEGEVHIETGHEERLHYRPFMLATDHGSITPLGTRFSTRVQGEFSSVSVFEGAVAVQAVDGDGGTSIVEAGESLRFTDTHLQQTRSLDPAAEAWIRGFIIADKMPLAEFVAELSRYKTGVLRCDPTIADLHISGAFPIGNVDAVLASISKTLPVRVETFTPFWVMLKPA